MTCWQDIIIMICVFGLGLSLIPTIRGGHKPSLKTCVSSAILVVGLAITFITMKLWLSVMAEMVSAVAWVILAVQKRKLQRRVK